MDEALAEAQIERSRVYVTNAVKHFYFEPRGKFRLHKRPPAGPIKACMPWLKAELEVVKPTVVVLLGATAAQAVFGAKFRITRERGKLLTHDIAPAVIATLHPSAILRMPDATARAEGRAALISDLKLAARKAKSRSIDQLVATGFVAAVSVFLQMSCSPWPCDRTGLPRPRSRRRWRPPARPTPRPSHPRQSSGSPMFLPAG